MLLSADDKDRENVLKAMETLGIEYVEAFADGTSVSDSVLNGAITDFSEDIAQQLKTQTEVTDAAFELGQNVAKNFSNGLAAEIKLDFKAIHVESNGLNIPMHYTGGFPED